MRWFRRKDTRQAPCPQCSTLLPVDAETCDLCGADLREFPVRRPIPIEDRPEPRRGG